MIVTVTANTTMDQTVYIPSLQVDKTIRATRTYHSMGGKPTDASWILGLMGITSLALGFKAGVIGDQIESMLQGRGVSTDFVPVGGSSRMNVVIIAEDEHTHTTITTSTLDVTEEQTDALKKRFAETLDKATCVVIGGTLPQAMSPLFYTDMIKMARDKDVPVVFDANEPNLSAGLASSPTYVKPNEHELEALIGETVNDLETAYRGGRHIYDTYGTIPIVTLGKAGALAVLPDKTYRIPPIEVDVVSPAGAGDGVLAGITASIYRGDPIEEGIRLGIATATAVLLQPGTASCEIEDIERLLPQVELIPYTPS